MSQHRNKVNMSFRLSPTAVALINALARHTGLSQAGVLELAVRKLAALEGVQVDKLEGETNGTNE